jgi:hypothetical protein
MATVVVVQASLQRSIARRAAARVALALVLFAIGCQPSDTSPANPAQLSTHPVLVSPLERLHEQITQSYRLKPDRRFLIAFSVVHAVLTGEARTDTTAEFVHGVWRIGHNGTQVGELAELPTYVDALALLTQWSSNLLKGHPLKVASVAAAPWLPLSVDDAMNLLETTQQAWTQGERTNAAIAAAARALVSLQAQTFDEMRMADEIGGRALGLTAILKASGSATSSDEAALAEGLGYWGDARTLASPLDADDVARAFVLHDDDTLQQLAARASANEATRALLLRRLDARSDRTREDKWIHDELSESGYTLPVLFARLADPDILTERAISSSMPELVLLATLSHSGDRQAKSTARDLAGWTDPNSFVHAAGKIRQDLNAQDATLLDVFEHELDKVGGGLTGAIFDAATEQTYFRAAMYSGLHDAAMHTIYHWNSMPAAQAFLARWGTAGGAPAADFRLWMRELIDAQSGRRAATELLSTMKDLPAFGATAPLTLYRELAHEANWGDTRVLAAVKTTVARMDTRLDDRRALFGLAYDGLRDLVLSERVGRSLLADSPPFIGDPELRSAWLVRDGDWLKGRLNDAATTPTYAVATLVDLEAMDAMKDADVRAEARRRLALVRDDWPARRAFAGYLEKKGAFKEEQDLAQEWLDRNAHAAGLDPLAATVTVARALYLQGSYAEGWRVVAPIVNSQYGGAMQRGAFLLFALGRTDEAEELARARVDRYPTIESVADLAELYWRHDQNDEAAKLFAVPRVAASWSQVRWVVGAAFVRAFDKRPTADAVAAFGAMASVDPHWRREIATEVDLSGRHDLAFALEEPLAAPGMENLEFLMRSYHFLEQAKTHDDAVSWLKPRVPPPLLEPLSQFAFGAKADDLLWEIVPTPAAERTDDASDDVWQFRAAALARGSSQSRRSEVTDHYRRPVGGRYDVLARYLLGMVDERRVLAVANQPHDACEVAYWLGFRAQLDGRYGDASQWYRMAVESGLDRVWEYRQSYDQLYDWQSSAKALSLLPGAR